MTTAPLTLRAAYAYCRRLARRHYENFPVASLLVPRQKRDALAVIYAFARYADDVADEPGVEGRLEALAEWRQKLVECYEGPRGRADHPVFLALGDTVRRYRLSQAHFENLLRAFEFDVQVHRHQDFASLLAYCACSANPVGRLVLELFGHREPELWALSDNICTGLQLANFWQDVAVDLERDRIYLPLDDLRSFNLSLADLRALLPSGGGQPDERWQHLMTVEIRRTQDFFEQGKDLPEKVVLGLRRQLRLTWLGGMAILAKIESVRYDVFRRRPTLGRLDFLRLYLMARRPIAWSGPRDRAATTASHR